MSGEVKDKIARQNQRKLNAKNSAIPLHVLALESQAFADTGDSRLFLLIFLWGEEHRST
jgi:hypothetical protein